VRRGDVGRLDEDVAAALEGCGPVVRVAEADAALLVEDAGGSAGLGRLDEDDVRLLPAGVAVEAEIRLELSIAWRTM